MTKYDHLDSTARPSLRARIRHGVRAWNALLDAGAARATSAPSVRDYPYPQD